MSSYQGQKGKNMSKQPFFEENERITHVFEECGSAKERPKSCFTNGGKQLFEKKTVIIPSYETRRNCA